MDGYNEGYAKGKQDAKDGNSRNPTPPMLKAVVSDKFTNDFIEA